MRRGWRTDSEAQRPAGAGASRVKLSIILAITLPIGCGSTAHRAEEPAPHVSAAHDPEEPPLPGAAPLAYFICHREQEDLCYVTHPARDATAQAQERCHSRAGAVWSRGGACPPGIVAECSNERDDETRYFYGDYPFEAAQASCTSPLVPPFH